VTPGLPAIGADGARRDSSAVTREPPGTAAVAPPPELPGASGSWRTPGARVTAITPAGVGARPRTWPNSCETTVSKSILSAAGVAPVDQPQPAAVRSIQISPLEVRPSQPREIDATCTGTRSSASRVWASTP